MTSQCEKIKRLKEESTVLELLPGYRKDILKNLELLRFVVTPSRLSKILQRLAVKRTVYNKMNKEWVLNSPYQNLNWAISQVINGEKVTSDSLKARYAQNDDEVPYLFMNNSGSLVVYKVGSPVWDYFVPNIAMTRDRWEIIPNFVFESKNETF